LDFTIIIGCGFVGKLHRIFRLRLNAHIARLDIEKMKDDVGHGYYFMARAMIQFYRRAVTRRNSLRIDFFTFRVVRLRLNMAFAVASSTAAGARV